MYDFSQVPRWIDRAYAGTLDWIRSGGLGRAETPRTLLPHEHEEVP
jgi:hypothetical protein